MLQDPRHKNKIFNTATIGDYLRDYADSLRDALVSVDTDQLDLALESINICAKMGKRIFAIGNGGSSSVAEHLSCDMTKGTHCHGHNVIDTTSMSANTALYSAIANDFGFENVFSTQVDMLGQPGDILIAISSSGNSENIWKAVEAANAKSMVTIGLTGFKGGKLRDTAGIKLHVDIENYGIVEDVHMSLMHVMAQYIAAQRDGRA